MDKKATACIETLDHGCADAIIYHGKWRTKSHDCFSSAKVAENQIKKFCKQVGLEIEGEIKVR